MELTKIKRIRLAHMLVVSVFVVVTILDGVRAALPYWEFVLATGFILCWILGVRYERQVILSSGLLDATELRLAERNASSWIFQLDEDPEDPRA